MPQLMRCTQTHSLRYDVIHPDGDVIVRVTYFVCRKFVRLGLSWAFNHHLSFKARIWRNKGSEVSLPVRVLTHPPCDVMNRYLWRWQGCSTSASTGGVKPHPHWSRGDSVVGGEGDCVRHWRAFHQGQGSWPHSCRYYPLLSLFLPLPPSSLLLSLPPFPSLSLPPTLFPSCLPPSAFFPFFPSPSLRHPCLA